MKSQSGVGVDLSIMSRELTINDVVEWIRSADQEEIVMISHLCIEQLVMMANAKRDLMMGVVGILSSREYDDPVQLDSEPTPSEQD
jgi:hypothetical protein